MFIVFRRKFPGSKEKVAFHLCFIKHLLRDTPPTKEYEYLTRQVNRATKAMMYHPFHLFLIIYMKTLSLRRLQHFFTFQDMFRCYEHRR